MIEDSRWWKWRYSYMVENYHQTLRLSLAKVNPVSGELLPLSRYDLYGRLNYTEEERSKLTENYQALDTPELAHLAKSTFEQRDELGYDALYCDEPKAFMLRLYDEAVQAGIATDLPETPLEPEQGAIIKSYWSRNSY